MHLRDSIINLICVANNNFPTAAPVVTHYQTMQQ